MAVIEKAIHAHFEEMAKNPPNPAEDGASQAAESIILASRPAPSLDPPFAKVSSVVAGSPAETAGLKAGDLIRNFGYVNRSNDDGLKRVADCVQANEGVSLLCSPLPIFICRTTS